MNNNHSSYAVSELYQEYADYMQKMRFSTAEFDAAEEILSDMDDKQEDEIRQEIRNFRKRYRKKFYIDTVPVKIYINQKIR